MPVIRRIHCRNCGASVDPNARCRCGKAHGRARRAERERERSTASARRLRAAAIAASPICAIRGCSATTDLTVDHLRYPATSLADVRVLCRRHNGMDAQRRQEGGPRLV
jgi:hypothetical protein